MYRYFIDHSFHPYCTWNVVVFVYHSIRYTRFGRIRVFPIHDCVLICATIKSCKSPCIECPARAFFFLFSIVCDLCCFISFHSIYLHKHFDDLNSSCVHFVGFFFLLSSLHILLLFSTRHSVCGGLCMPV